MSDDEAIETARRTKKHLGRFDTPQHATDYAYKLHDDQAELYGTGEVEEPLDRQAAMRQDDALTQLRVGEKARLERMRRLFGSE
jgi:hypothetical protein